MKIQTLFLCAAIALLAADDAGQRWWSHVRFLADDKLEGRKPGTQGYEEAARYVAGEFDKLKLRPAGTKGFFQPVPMQVKRMNEAESKLELLTDSGAQPLDFARDGFLGARGEPGHPVEAQAVFVGYGLRIPEAKVDDLAGLDLKGKIAVVLSGAPKDVPGPLAAHAQSAAERWRNLRAAGAIGTATIYNTNRGDIPWDRVALSRTQPSLSLAVPELVETSGQQVSIVLGPEGADKLLAGTGHTFAELLRLDRENQPLPKFPLKSAIRARAAFSVENIGTENVAAALPGTDPKLRNEYIVFSAHLDHLGKGAAINGDPIYNGAMDNASGIATLIEVARAMNGKRLKRSVIFAAVTGEEGGLLGSKFFAYRPPMHGRIVADLNSDMFLPIIPLKAITVLGLDESTLGRDFAAVAKSMGVPAEPDSQPQRNGFIRSDQYSFIRRGIPSLAFKFHAYPDTPEAQTLADWLKQRYHAPSDDLTQPVNLEGAAKFSAIMAEFLERVANQPEAPSWNESSFFRRYAAPN